jgi:hypothetical protein
MRLPARAPRIRLFFRVGYDFAPYDICIWWTLLPHQAVPLEDDMVNWRTNPRGQEGFPALTRPAPEGPKPLTAFTVLSALLALGRALEVAAAVPSRAGDVLNALVALGMIALGAGMARLIGGGPSEEPAFGGLSLQFGFFRHPSDRPPHGRASGRHGGEA